MFSFKFSKLPIALGVLSFVMLVSYITMSIHGTFYVSRTQIQDISNSMQINLNTKISNFRIDSSHSMADLYPKDAESLNAQFFAPLPSKDLMSGYTFVFFKKKIQTYVWKETNKRNIASKQIKKLAKLRKKKSLSDTTILIIRNKWNRRYLAHK